MTTTTMMPLGNLIENFFGSKQCQPSGNRMPHHSPRAQVLEGDAEYLIRLDLPGVSRSDDEIEIENETLTIKSTRSMEAKEGYRNLRNELSEKMNYRRSFDLGHGIAVDKIEAGFENGVLNITLPKTEQALPKRIEVQ